MERLQGMVEPMGNTDPAAVLQEILEQHALAGVALWPCGEPPPRPHHQSLVIEVDAQAGRFFIERPFPEGFSAEPGNRVALRVALGGARNVVIEAHVIALERDQVALTLPSRIDRQRRATARACPSGRPAWVEFGLVDDRQFAARLVDVSTDGMQLDISGPFQPPLAAGVRLWGLRCRLGARYLCCDARVRYVARQGQESRIGVSLLCVPAADKRWLRALSSPS